MSDKKKKIKVKTKTEISLGTRVTLLVALIFTFYIMAYSLAVFSAGAAHVFTMDIKSDLKIYDPCDPQNLSPKCPLNK